MILVWSELMALIEAYLAARRRRLLSDHVAEMTALGVFTVLWWVALGAHFAWGYRVRRALRRSDGEFDSPLSPQ